MLLIQGISLAGLGYYFDHASTEADGSDGHLGRARYGGEVARRLDVLGRDVDREGLEAILQGRHDGQLEGSPPSRRRTRHAFIDVVFPSPKSVSLLFGLSGEETQSSVLAAHLAARDCVLDYLERQCAWVKLSTGSRDESPAEGLLWAPFVHLTSRSGDPHLHSHALVANLVPSRARGWSPLDSGPLLAERLAAGELFRCALRFELHERLGVDFRSRSAPGSDVAGFSDHALDAFSTRSMAILEHERDRTTSTFTARRVRGYLLRPEKQAEAPLGALRDEWSSRALRLGILPSRDVRASTASERLLRGPNELGEATSDVVAGALGAFDAPFARSDLLAAAGRALPFGVPVALLEARVDAALAPFAALEEGRDGVGRSDARRFDRRPGQRFANATVAAAMAAEAAFCEEVNTGAELLGSLLGAIDEGGDQVVGLFETNDDPLRAYEGLRVLRGVAHEHGLGVRLEFPTWYARSAFEAATGPEVPSPNTTAAGRVAGLTMLLDAARHSVVARNAILSRARAEGGHVVVCGLDIGCPPKISAPSAAVFDRTAEGIEPVRSYAVFGGVEVLVASSLRSAVAAIWSLREKFGDSLEVAADRRFVSLFRPQVGDGHGSSESKRGDPEVIVAFGDATHLGGRGRAVRRIHVVVAPPEGRSDDERAIAFAVAAWSRGAYRARHTVFSSSARLAWGWQELIRYDRAGGDRSHDALGHQAAPERGPVGRGEREVGHRGAEEQHRPVPRAVRDGIGRESPLSP